MNSHLNADLIYNEDFVIQYLMGSEIDKIIK